MHSCEISDAGIVVSGVIGPAARRPYYNVKLTYSLSREGLCINTEADAQSYKDNDGKEHILYSPYIGEFHLPRFAMQFTLKPGFENVKYLGMGPYECYVDFKEQSMMGVWENTVDGMYEAYIKPQENGSHYNTKWAEVSSGETTVTFTADETMEFSALHFTPELIESALHRGELVPQKNTTVMINYKIGGIGSNSCGPVLDKKYQLRDKKINFKFSIK